MLFCNAEKVISYPYKIMKLWISEEDQRFSKHPTFCFFPFQIVIFILIIQKPTFSGLPTEVYDKPSHTPSNKGVIHLLFGWWFGDVVRQLIVWIDPIEGGGKTFFRHIFLILFGMVCYNMVLFGLCLYILIFADSFIYFSGNLVSKYGNDFIVNQNNFCFYLSVL